MSPRNSGRGLLMSKKFTLLTLCNLCVISSCFHSFIFKLCITIVHTLKMCTSDAGPEQSLVLFSSEIK